MWNKYQKLIEYLLNKCFSKYQWLKLTSVIIVSYFLIYYLYYSRTLDYVFIEKLFYFAPKRNIEKIVQDAKKYMWLFPTVVVVFILIRILFLSFIQFIGSYINENRNISFKQIFTIFLISEIILFARDFLIIVISVFSENPHFPFIDISLSLDELFSNSISSYPGMNIIFSSINIYMLLYFYLIAFLFSVILSKKLLVSLRYTFLYIGVGYAIWILFSAGLNLYVSK